MIPNMRGLVIPVVTALVAYMVMMWPVALAAESVIIPVEFNTASNESFTIAVLGDGNCVSATSPSTCSYGIVFNCTAGENGNCEWANASSGSSMTAQDPETSDQAIFIATNTGTATLDLTMKADSDIYTVDNCLNMTYTFEEESSCTTTDYGPENFTGQLKTTDITLNSSWTVPATQICIWMFGNFSSCTSGTDSTYIYFNSTVV